MRGKGSKVPTGEQQREQLLYVHNVAEVLKCSKKFVYAQIRDGNLGAIRLGPRAIRVPKSALDEYLQERTIDPQDYDE